MSIVRLAFICITWDSVLERCEHLQARNILPLTGNPKWTRAAIDKMLKKRKYVTILGLDDYLITQADRDLRSDIDEDSGK